MLDVLQPVCGAELPALLASPGSGGVLPRIRGSGKGGRGKEREGTNFCRFY